MTAQKHLAAIEDSDTSDWQPNLTSSATLIGWYEIRSDLVTVISGAASQVANRVAGGANPLIQPLSLSSQRPTYEATGWNGKPSLLFDGTNNFMTAHGLAASVTGTDVPYSVVMVSQIVTIGVVSGNNRAAYCFGNGTDDNPLSGFTILDGTSSGALSRRDNAGALKQRAQAAALTTSRATYTDIFTGTRIKRRINGVADSNLDGVTSPSAEVDVGAMTLDQFSVGCAVRTTAAWPINMRLAAMLVFAGALSNSDALLNERYLTTQHPL